MSSEPQENAESSNFIAFDKTNNDNNRGYRSNFQYRPYNRHQNYRQQNFRRNQHQQQFGGAPQNDGGDGQFSPANFSSPVHHQQHFDNGFRHRPNQMNQFQHRRNFVPFNVRISIIKKFCVDISEVKRGKFFTILFKFIYRDLVEIQIKLQDPPHQFNSISTKVCSKIHGLVVISSMVQMRIRAMQ